MNATLFVLYAVTVAALAILSGMTNNGNGSIASGMFTSHC